MRPEDTPDLQHKPSAKTVAKHENSEWALGHLHGLGDAMDTPEGFLRVDEETQTVMRERVYGLLGAVVLLGGFLLIGAYSLNLAIQAIFALAAVAVIYTVVRADFSGGGPNDR